MPTIGWTELLVIWGVMLLVALVILTLQLPKNNRKR